MDQPERAVRASDAEREQVSRQLGAHAAAGRLTPEELDERLDAAYAARTHAELDRLLVDLPGPPAPRVPDRTREVARAHLAHRAGLSVIACAGVRRDLGRRRRQRVVLADLGHPPRRGRACPRELADARPGGDAERRGARRAPARAAPLASRSPVAITTAVVPVAGLATRLRPLSRGVPKALLPVAARPVIQHIVDELAACGIERVVLVTGRGRGAFAAHFARARGPEVVCAVQPRPLGLGDAILAAAPLLDGPFVVALGDALLGAGPPARAVARLADAVEGGATAAIAVEEVDAARTDRYGIVAPAGEGEPLPVAQVVEKPAPGAAPSRLAVAGRYAATPALLEALLEAPPERDGGASLSDALCALDGLVALRLAPGEERLDVGTIAGYCDAFLVHALADPQLGPGLRARARALLDGER